jgi:hypothetical protein
MRADDQSRNISAYNNVAFNCGLAPVDDAKSSNTGIGLIVKGDGHVLFANTLFSTNYTELCMPACEEPEKDWEAQYPLSESQNSNTNIFNTAALNDFGYPCSCSNKTENLNNPGGNTSGVYHGDLDELSLVDPANFGKLFLVKWSLFSIDSHCIHFQRGCFGLSKIQTFGPLPSRHW